MQQFASSAAHGVGLGVLRNRCSVINGKKKPNPLPYSRGVWITYQAGQGAMTPVDVGNPATINY